MRRATAAIAATVGLLLVSTLTSHGAPAPVVAPCVTVTSNAAGFTQENCNYVTPNVGLPTVTGSYPSAGTGQYGVSITSVTSLTVPAKTIAAEICVGGTIGSVAARYTDDGTTPTASVGIPVLGDNCFQYAGPLAAFRIIGSGATMDVSYYRND